MAQMVKNLLGGKEKTFKPKKNIKEGSKRFELHKQLQATLGSGDLRSAVKLPPGEDPNEWLAVNKFKTQPPHPLFFTLALSTTTFFNLNKLFQSFGLLDVYNSQFIEVIDFFNQINLLYGSITEFCTPKSCPVMSAGPKYEYLWADGKNIKKPIKVSAAEYADYLMTWVQNILEDETIFPVNDDTPFPKSFKSVVKTIFKRLFRIYAHIYYSHAQEIVDLGVEAHLNTAFKHFYLFIREFDLVEMKEMEPLKYIIDKILAQLKEKDENGTHRLHDDSEDADEEDEDEEV